jgi:hypothetical protein
MTTLIHQVNEEPGPQVPEIHLGPVDRFTGDPGEELRAFHIQSTGPEHGYLDPTPDEINEKMGHEDKKSGLPPGTAEKEKK